MNVMNISDQEAHEPRNQPAPAPPIRWLHVEVLVTYAGSRCRQSRILAGGHSTGTGKTRLALGHRRGTFTTARHLVQPVVLGFRFFLVRCVLYYLDCFADVGCCIGA